MKHHIPEIIGGTVGLATSASYASTARVAQTVATRELAWGRITTSTYTPVAGGLIPIGPFFLNTQSNITLTSGALSGFTVGKVYEFFFSPQVSYTNTTTILAYRWYINGSLTGNFGIINANSNNNARQPIAYAVLALSSISDVVTVRVTQTQGDPVVEQGGTMFYVKEV